MAGGARQAANPGILTEVGDSDPPAAGAGVTCRDEGLELVATEGYAGESEIRVGWAVEVLDTHGDVEPSGRDFLECPRGVHLHHVDLEARARACQRRSGRNDDRPGGGLEGSDADHADVSGSMVLQVGVERLEAGEQLSGVVEKYPGSRRETDVAAVALDDGAPDLSGQEGELLGHRGRA
jgi:hypothetical protein